MFYYYWTGTGGETLLAMTCIPVIYVLFTLQSLREQHLSIRSCRWPANYVIAAVYCASPPTVPGT